MYIYTRLRPTTPTPTTTHTPIYIYIYIYTYYPPYTQYRKKLNFFYRALQPHSHLLMTYAFGYYLYHYSMGLPQATHHHQGETSHDPRHTTWAYACLGLGLGLGQVTPAHHRAITYRGPVVPLCCGIQTGYHSSR